MQRIKSTLDTAYAAIDAPSGDVKDQQIAQALNELSSEYQKLTHEQAPPIAYGGNARRFAYIYRYAAAHADYVAQLIHKSTALKALLSGGSVKLACLGGGPGSDLLGVLKYLAGQELEGFKLKCSVFDKEGSWLDSWSDIVKQENLPCEIDLEFKQIDVTEAENWGNEKELLTFDLLIFSFFLSEVWKFRNDADSYFEQLLSRMRPGAFVLFLDNADARFFGWFDGMSKKAGLKKIGSSECELTLSDGEQFSDFGKHFNTEKFEWPKRKGLVAWRIMQKPEE
jgi:SAM-dependent methyltransferase